MLSCDNYKEIIKNNLTDIVFYAICGFEDGCTTIDKIRKYLNNKKIKYTEEQLRLTINYLYSEYGLITRTDYYYGESIYEVMDYRRKDSSYTNHFRKFIDDNPSKEKKILLISDTHIGNKELENYKLINNIYEYAELNNCEYVFHEGDLFEGLDDNRDINILEKQINDFRSNYPKSKIKTICIQGNHDEWFSGKMRFSYDNGIDIFPRYYNLKSLNRLNENFYFYEANSWTTTLNNIPIHIGHKLYICPIILDKKIDSISEIDEDEDFLDDDYKVLISGHLHKGIIYSPKKVHYSKDGQIIYLGVPSLSNINIGNACAYLLTINNDIMNISVLSSNNNCKIKELETIDWKFDNTNKILRKTY